MPDEDRVQRAIDEEHVKLLSIGYKVSAAVAAFYGCFGLIYVFMGLAMTFAPTSPGSSLGSEGDFIGLWFFTLFGVAFVAVGVTIATLRWMAGVRLSQRRSPLFCQIVAGFTCLETPYGTALGVLTFVVLSRPSVRAMFDRTTEQGVPATVASE